MRWRRASSPAAYAATSTREIPAPSARMRGAIPVCCAWWKKSRTCGRWTGRDFFPVVIMRSEEHTSELQSLMRISYAVFCLKKKMKQNNRYTNEQVVNTQTLLIHTTIPHTLQHLNNQRYNINS